MKPKIKDLKDNELANLVNNRWASSESVWSIIESTYKTNTSYYDNNPDWLKKVPTTIQKVQANRITPNMESVINSVIANPPGLNFIPGRMGEESEELARKLEKFFLKKYRDRNVKEDMRMGLRNLYFGRLIVLKPFWNPQIDDFDVKAIDPRDVRFSKTSTKEEESEFAIERVKDSLCNLLARFPEKSKELLEKSGYSEEKINEAYIANPEIEYYEAWIGDYVIFKYDNIILDKIRNPYWDWDGILVTDEEQEVLDGNEDEGGVYGESRRNLMTNIKLDQDNRSMDEDIDPNEGHSESLSYKSYFFNYFNQPRKPYIYATILNNENKPIGRTDFITLSIPLQESIDRRKQDIGQNCELMNGVIKVDSDVMSKADAQALAYQAKGIIWGSGVVDGVVRETGQALPGNAMEDMLDSRNEIDNIMAASSAFRGEREGQETKAGRLALIEQSYLRLNELVQVVDNVYGELFGWFYQLAKTRYTEEKYAKWLGQDEASEIIGLMQDDFETGSEVQVVPGKTLPVDSEFRFERAQQDVAAGILSPVDYMQEAGYTNPNEMAKNAQLYKLNPNIFTGITEEEMAEYAPAQKEDKPPNVTINYKDLPPDAQVQLLGQIDIQANPELLLGERMADRRDKQTEIQLKRKTDDGTVEVTQNTE